MRKAPTTMLRHLGTLYGHGSLVGYTDSQLLDRFVASMGLADRTEADIAFASLVDRHARVVWHVCRSLLPDEHDAEDAFQATFLVLLRKAASLRVRNTLAPWLHDVAYRTALNSRRASARRRSVGLAVAASSRRPNQGESIAAELERRELSGFLHQAIAELPSRHRSAVILCDVDGLSYLDAAATLRVPVGTLQSRLARAREKLRAKLTQRGVTCPALSPGLRSPSVITWIPSLEGPPLNLTDKTCHLAWSSIKRQCEQAATISGSIRQLAADGSWIIAHSRVSAIATLAVTAIVSGGALVVWNQTSADAGANAGRQSSGALERLGARPQAPALPDANVPITPAPSELKVSTGKGKARVYALDDAGERIRDRANDRPRPFRETLLDVRWAVVTGVVDHRAIQKSFTNGDGVAAAVAEEIYRRVDLERQTQDRVQRTWSTWNAVDWERKYRVIDNLPERGREPTNARFRLDALVDPTPVLAEGVWKGLDVERLVPHLVQGKLVDPLNEIERLEKLAGARPPVLMLRAFDFTVEPGKTYRYRARLVFYSPPEVRRVHKREEILGPWSEPSDPVEVAEKP
jgi:RNA polymerase sigma factor (sigma-70 family)